MINVHIAEWISSSVTLILAYLIIETVAGAFTAWIAKKAGDQTAEKFGYLSLNPLVHVDSVGMLCLIFLGFGWSQSSENAIDTGNIQGPLRRFKVACVSFSGIISRFLLALACIVTLLKMFDVQALYVVLPMVLSGSISMATFASYYPGAESFQIAFALLLVAIIYLAVLLGIFKFFFKLFYLIAYLCDIQVELDIAKTLIIALLLCWATAYVRLYLVVGLAHAGYLIAHFLGM